MPLLVSELHNWMTHPITQKIYKELHIQRKLELDSIVCGACIEDHAKLTHRLGIIEGLDRFLELDIKDLQEVQNNEIKTARESNNS